MWIVFAFGSALFAGLTAVLAKCGIKKTDSDVATAVRTVIVLIFSWLMVWIVGSASTITEIGTRSWIFLVLSGMATGASWLCYFRALGLGDVNKVVPIDKSSTVLTILLALIFLGEQITWIKAVAVVLIGVGTFLMIEKKKNTEEKVPRRGWLIYAVLSAVFASLTSILGKVGIDGVESNLGTPYAPLSCLPCRGLLCLSRASSMRCAAFRAASSALSVSREYLPAARGSAITRRFETGLRASSYR